MIINHVLRPRKDKPCWISMLWESSRDFHIPLGTSGESGHCNHEDHSLNHVNFSFNFHPIRTTNNLFFRWRRLPRALPRWTTRRGSIGEWHNDWLYVLGLLVLVNPCKSQNGNVTYLNSDWWWAGGRSFRFSFGFDDCPNWQMSFRMSGLTTSWSEDFQNDSSKELGPGGGHPRRWWIWDINTMMENSTRLPNLVLGL